MCDKFAFDTDTIFFQNARGSYIAAIHCADIRTIVPHEALYLCVVHSGNEHLMIVFQSQEKRNEHLNQSIAQLHAYKTKAEFGTYPM